MEEEITFTELINEVLEMEIEPIIEEIPIEPIITLKVPQLSSYGLLDRYLIKY